MIRYNTVYPRNIKTGLLNGYKRQSETSRVKYVEDGILKEKADFFKEDWDQEKLHSIEQFMKKKQNITIIAKDQSQTVGFLVVDTNSFDGYMNVPYIHTDARYRGLGIGKNLILLGSKTAKDLGAEKLYISGHPDINTQAFYEKIGCVLAQKINQTLYEIEPLDIQLELSLDFEDIMMKKIKLEFKQYHHVSSTTLNKLLPRIYSVMPKDDLEFLKTVKPLLIDDRRSYFSMGTLLLKKRGTVVDEKYFKIYEDILLNHIRDWGQVDQYCYRVLGPIFNANYELFYKLQEWSKSTNKDVRRASLVSMLLSYQKVICTYPLHHVLELVESLKEDADFHVRKAVGWVLKCAYVEYPEAIIKYLTQNRQNLDRMIFRYALEHMDEQLKKQMLQK